MVEDLQVAQEVVADHTVAATLRINSATERFGETMRFEMTSNNIITNQFLTN